MIRLIQIFLQKFNVQLKRYPDADIRRRLKIIRSQNINCILDIGANTGQFAVYMRNYGYRQKILSFEPLKNAFQKLQSSSQKDPKWQAFHFALGHENTRSFINVSNNSSSSSILEMLPQHLESAPHSKFIDKEDIEVKALDAVFSDLCDIEDNIMLKIDTQGYEKNVLEGAKASLQYVKIIQLEMSIVPLYDNEMLFRDMIDYLEKLGFKLFSLENGFANPETGQLLQVDGVFVREKS